MNLYREYPQITWDIDNIIIFDKSVDIDFIREHVEEITNWETVSAHSNIRFEDLRGLPLSWKGLSRNPNLTKEIILENPDQDWDWKELSVRFLPELLLLLPNKPWNINQVYDSTPENILRFPNHNWNWSSMIFIPALILAYPDKPWNWPYFSSTATPDDILNYPDWPWNWEILSGREVILDEVFGKLLHKPWNLSRIGNRFVERYPDLEWPWHELLLDGELMLKFPEKPWNWSGIFERSVVQTVFPLYPDKPWNLNRVLAVMTKETPPKVARDTHYCKKYFRLDMAPSEAALQLMPAFGMFPPELQLMIAKMVYWQN